VEETVKPSEITTGALVDVMETEGFTTGAPVNAMETKGFSNRPGYASDSEAIDVTEIEGTKGFTHSPGDASDDEAIDVADTKGFTRLDNPIAIGTSSPDCATVKSSCTGTSPFPISTEATFCLQGNFSKGEHPPP
jgi:hypothetical protein